MFKRAERKKAKLRLALCAPSGAGKTYSALKIAQGLGGKIAMIDTEHGSGELYADMCEYDVLQLDPPYTPQKYIEGIKAAENAGYDIVIVDSLSHAWAGEGGLLEEVDKKAKASRSGNSYTAWRDVTPLHNQLVNAMLTSSCHIIATMRSKVAYEMQTNNNGKMSPVKIGLAPVQREGMDYEFTVVLDISVEGHYATASKDRTSLFDGQTFIPSHETGEQLMQWLNTGAEPPKMHNLELISSEFNECDSVDCLNVAIKALELKDDHPQRNQIGAIYKNAKANIEQLQVSNEPEMITDPQRRLIRAHYGETKLSDELRKQDMATRLGLHDPISTKELTKDMASKLIESFEQA